MMNSAEKCESVAKWGCSLPLIIIVLLPFIGYPIREFQTSNGRKTLPSPEVDSTTYFEHTRGDDYLRVSRYHNGTVYVLESSW
jgi:hypothetical protein